MDKLRMSGILYSTPLGAAAAVLYAYAAGEVRGLSAGTPGAGWTGLTGADVRNMVLIFAVIVAAVWIGNLKKYYVDGQEDFGPRSMRKKVTDASSDKLRAQNGPVPDEYLSRTPDGLTVGRRGRMYVRIPFLSSPEHQLIYGSPGSKKSNVIKNALLEIFNGDGADVGAVLAVDCKPELSRDCVYEGRSDVKVVNPSVSDRYGFDVYYGLAEDSTDDDLKARFSLAARTLIVNPGGDNAFFYVSAQNILTAFLMYGFRKGYSFGESVLQVMEASTEDLISTILNDQKMDDHPKIKRLVREFDGRDSDAFQDVSMTLQQDLSIFDVDTVQRCFDSSKAMKASPADLERGTSIFIAIPDNKLKMYSAVFRLIIQLCLDHMMGLPEHTRTGKKPVWFLLDEAGSIGPIPDLLEALARGRSKGIAVTLVCQSYAQMEQTYGREGATTITDCCKTEIVLSCNSTTTAKSLSERTGTYRETKVSTSTRYSGIYSGSAGSNRSEEYRPVMDVSDITALEKREKVLVFARGSWFLADKAPYYTIPQHKELSDRIREQNRKFYPEE